MCVCNLVCIAVCLSGLPEKDLQKLKYTLDEVEQADAADPFAATCVLDAALLEVGGLLFLVWLPLPAFAVRP